MTQKDPKERGGWNSAPDYIPQGNIGRDYLILGVILFSIVIVTILVATKT